MFCHICLTESVKGQIGRLKLCLSCFEKVKKHWDKEDVKRY